MIKLTDIKKQYTKEEEYLLNLNEEQLFNALKQAIPDLAKSEWTYDRKDAKSPRNKAVYELKCRNQHYPTMLIEKDKYEALKVYSNPNYINSTPKGIYNWDLTTITIKEWKKEWHSCTTKFANNDKKCLKDVAYLPVTAATNITRTILN